MISSCISIDRFLTGVSDSLGFPGFTALMVLIVIGCLFVCLMVVTSVGRFLVFVFAPGSVAVVHRVTRIIEGKCY